MGLPSFNKVILCITLFCFALSPVSHAERYYDPKTRRYIQKEYKQRIQRQKVQVKMLTHEEIEFARQKAEQERLAEKERLQRIRESASTESRRRYDPNRYHRTEEVVFTSI